MGPEFAGLHDDAVDMQAGAGLVRGSQQGVEPALGQQGRIVLHARSDNLRRLLVRDQTVEHRAASLVEGRRDAQPELSLAKSGRRRLSCLRDHFERGADRRQIVPALGRKRDGPRRATKKFYAEGSLQRLHMLADGAGGDAELVGGVLETHVARGGLEGAQAIQGRQSIGHDRSLRTKGSVASADGVHQLF